VIEVDSRRRVSDDPAEPAPPVPPVPPVPRYGEYAPSGYVAPAQPQADPYAAPQMAQPYGAASYPAQPGGKRRKTWDIVLTSILLAVGLFGMLIGVSYGVVFADPELLDEAFKQQGLSGFNGDVGSASSVLIISHVVLYLLAVGAAIPLLVTRKVAFWAPLAAGVIAAVIFWATTISVVASDPALLSQLS
jgi:hypothetical protein